ncbi:MAG: hypothetical protein LLG06_00730 [Desulfobacteraceae bacterium]|nr:hypothetical protein [Desulfobacteraceae bacterium]
MTTHEIVSELIVLQDEEILHRTEYLKLQHLPGKKTVASSHCRKAMRLRARIQALIKTIAQAGNNTDEPWLNSR